MVERYTYDPYGSVTILDASWNTRTSSSYAIDYLFQAGRYDFSTALYNFRNRDFSPALGRWMENDPLGLAAGDINQYRFNSNNPATYSDPFGLAAKTPWYKDRYGLRWDVNRIHGDLRQIFEDLTDPNKFTCDQLRELAKLLADSNRHRSRVINLDPSHVVRAIEENLLYLAVKALFTLKQCGGTCPEMKFDSPAQPKGYTVPSYITDTLNHLGVKLIRQRPNPNCDLAPSWRMRHVSPNLRDPYACIRCHPWDGRFNSPIALPHGPLSTGEKIFLGAVGVTTVVIVVIVTAPVSVPVAVCVPAGGAAAAGGGTVIGGSSSAAAAALLLALGLEER